MPNRLLERIFSVDKSFAIAFPELFIGGYFGRADKLLVFMLISNSAVLLPFAGCQQDAMLTLIFHRCQCYCLICCYIMNHDVGCYDDCNDCYRCYVIQAEFSSTTENDGHDIFLQPPTVGRYAQRSPHRHSMKKKW